jgi:hypothetical protein
MTDGVLWRGNWASSVYYNKGDLVFYSGVVYITVESHSSTSIFDADISNWAEFNSLTEWNLSWQPSTRYGIGDLVKYNGIVYKCIQGHTSGSTVSSGLEPDQNKWTVYFNGIEYRGDWVNNARYRVNDLVKFGGSLWRCTVGHLSGDDSSLNFASDFWTLETPGEKFRGVWMDDTAYGVGDIVRYGGYLYVATRNDIGEVPSSGIGWNIVTKNYNFRGIWSRYNNYKTGDVTLDGGNLYIAIADSTGKNAPTTTYVNVTVGSASASDTSPGSKFSFNGLYRPNYGLEIENTYVFIQNDPTNVYYPNTVGTTPNVNPLGFSTSVDGILNAGQAFIKNVVYKLDEVEVSLDEYIDRFVEADARTVTITIDRNVPQNLNYFNFNSLNSGAQFVIQPLTTGIQPANNNSAWTVLTPGVRWVGGWITDRFYAVGDIVSYENISYRCNYSHFSNDLETYPNNGNGFNYWDVYLEGDNENALSKKGDLLNYNVEDDQSTIGPTPINIGELGQQLTIQNNDSIGYQEHGFVRNFLYVRPDGIDEIGYGTTPGKPFKTIRYATEYTRDYLTGETTIFVKTGVYDEVLPIIVPQNTAILGEELRSVTVRPADANENYQLDSTYRIAVLNRIRDFIGDLILNNPVTKTIGNTAIQNRNYVAGSFASIAIIQGLIDNIKDYIDFYVNSTGLPPTVTGSNTPNNTSGLLLTKAILEGNKDFIVAEALAFLSFNYSEYEFDSVQYTKDIKKYIDAFQYDLIYTGNYRTVLEARYYRNLVQGSKTEDMFYVRNATGLRNMTFKGLEGTLNPPQVNELYRRPTGGSYVSLDPGWGPADESTWITTRSCYVQNVTTFGYAATGQKIDGALHNGGNKSIVSNDFTQVISDGIGCHVLNNGRAELVSVFTYYAQIGMFAELGGVIRATNGNSSYGDFGALADGNDPTETPRFGFVNNRTTEATVVSALAGEVSDEILLLEFSNAGQNYTTASYTIIGSGTGASALQEEIRDNAVFEFQVRNPFNDLNATEGGGGYILKSGNAQEGGLTSIKLASNDESTPAELLGLRIIITSGDGTGQYGYVSAYNDTTKVLDVRKESDGQPGWDHVIAGYPIFSLLTTSTVYKFEPRITISSPGYSTSLINLSASTPWTNIVYGETSQTYTNIQGSAGLGSTNATVPVTALWNITKLGRSYVVTLANPGAGYQDEQTITILGSQVGGVSGENDITIRVKSVSNDSTNSIITFSHVGIASSGRFVATPSSSAIATSSLNGDTWNSYSLPSSGNWQALAAGNNRFVALKFGSNEAAMSLDGISWTPSTLSSSRNWTAAAYGNGVFLGIASNLNSGTFSLNGINWAATTLPTAGDSTINQWVDVAYGEGKFVVLANSNNIVADGTYNPNTNTWTWASNIMDTVADSSQKDWVSIAYGNNRWVAISSTGDVAYSLDSDQWYPATLPTQDGSTAHSWTKIRYGQGVFFAVGTTGSRTVFGDTTTGPTNFAATSPDGVTWTSRTLPVEVSWSSVAFGNPDISLGDSTLTNSRPMWVAVSSDPTSQAAKIFTGTKALGRAIVETGRIRSIRIWDPGSGYDSTPTITITDPNATSPAFINPRLGDGVLTQPSWANRGINYRTSSTRVSVVGDGFADVIPRGNIVSISDLTVIPGTGSQFRFRGETNFYTVNTIEDQEETNGTFSATFRISPTLTYNYNLEHNAQVEIRERYSQVRITGHDFLDVGTGNFEQTNYPEIYGTGNFNSSPENEIVEADGGRVFYTSTDQSGNFRTGELFAVEQATGVVTISADFFDLEGLTELALGGVRLGGSAAVVREFSTDPLFTADSNNVVSTQRAIKSYLSLRLSIGGSDLSVPSFIAGQVLVGPNRITTTTGTFINLPKRVNISGTQAGISGFIMAQTLFYGSFVTD